MHRIICFTLAFAAPFLVEGFASTESRSARIAIGASARIAIGATKLQKDAKYRSSSGSLTRMSSQYDATATGSRDTRRDFLQQASVSAALASSLLIPSASNAADGAEDAKYPKITDKVYFDMRISRQDGTFYVRDDLPDTPENKVFYGRLTLGLFGTAAPVHVEQFLKYCVVAYDAAEIDQPKPSYGKSTFNKYDDATGLLEGGFIPSLEITDIGGGTSLRYGSRLIPAKLWFEKTGEMEKISHVLGKGLLTHKTLDLLPSFGVTTRPAAELDATHFVFGRIIPDESSEEFIRIIRDEVPTYSMDRPSQSDALPTTEAERASGELASRVFSAQRDFFRGAAKSFGDTRVDKIYEGKLLRRVEVTKVGIL